MKIHPAIMAILLLSGFPFSGQAGRIQPSDLLYQGAFRVPGPGDERGWGWGGSALTYYPAGDPAGSADGYPGSLWGTGHDWYQNIAEISIPVPIISPLKKLSQLNTAQTIQPLTDIRSLLFGEFEIPRVGLEYLPAQGDQDTDKLYFCWTQHLQTSPQTATHGWCELNLSSPQPSGPWYIAQYDTYSTSDYICSIPTVWAQNHLGGTALATGRFRDGGQGGQGPCLYVYHPWTAGNPPRPNEKLEAQPLLQYSTSYWDDPDGGAYKMDRYHHSDMWSGAAWLTAGDDSAVIFAGTKGRGDCWYGNQDGPCHECDNRGWWSTYFDGEIIFYDPADLAAVARGDMEPYEPQPYAVMNIDPLLYHIDSQQMYDHVNAVTFDREHGLLYIFEPLVDDSKPIVHVWKVSGEQSEPTPLPKPTPTAPISTPSPSEGWGCAPLPPPEPGELTVTVSSLTALQSEIDSTSDRKTIYLTNGTYLVTGYGIVVNQPGITIRSLEGNRDSVIIQGEGMATGNSYFGVYINEGDFTLADITVRDVRYHGIFIDPGSAPSNFLFHNIRVLDCGQQLFKSSGGTDTGTKYNGVIRCSSIGYSTTLAQGDYTNGIDILNSHNWVIQDNTIKNIKAGTGGTLAGPAILCWQGSSGTVVERNRIIDCDMGISFGNSYDNAPSHSGGIIRNNFIKGYANSDFGICVSKSPGAAIINNTIYCPGSWPYSIEVQYPESSGCLLMNNLADEPFYPDRFGANNPQMTTNITNAQADYFVNPALGHLHLISGTLPPVNTGTNSNLRQSDIDGDRIEDGQPDIGADEFQDAPGPPTPKPSQPSPPPAIPTPIPIPGNRGTTIGDYNGDGTSDPAIYRPATGLWIIRGITRIYFGKSNHEPIPQDFDGDGDWDPAWFQPSKGLWKIREVSSFYFGQDGDIVLAGDFNGDGTAEAAWFDPITALWNVRGLGRGYFGRTGDIPIPSDFDGDNTLEPACFRPQERLWIIRNLSRFYFGEPGFIPIPGDYNGDGTTEAGGYNPIMGRWNLRGLSHFYFGLSGDLGLIGDFDGDGSYDPGLFRTEGGLWKIRGKSRLYFGTYGDTQVSSPY